MCPTDVRKLTRLEAAKCVNLHTSIMIHDKNEDQIIHFQKYLNNKHANFKFTCERENNRNLAFLDCSIKRKSNKFETSTHQKETFSGLGTSYFSFTPFIYMLNCLKT